MANPLIDLVLPAATARFVLLANHVLAAAPPATERLKTHHGRVLKVEVEGWRVPLPPPPPLALRITPAGLLEDAGDSTDVPDLRLRVDASQPLDSARRVVEGGLPAVQIEGDAGLAADVNWVIANVRWDLAADLERVFGPVVADAVSRAGERALATAKSLAQGVAGVLRKA